MLKNLINLVVISFLSFCTTAQLSGTYTIGGTSPDYPTIASAVSSLQSVGVNGPVTFNIRNGVYTEQITLTGWTGASSANLVTFQSESGDSTTTVWQFWNNSNTTIPITINGADHLKFSKLWIRSNLSGNYRKCVRVMTSVSNVSFNNCLFRGASDANNADENIVDVFGGFGVNFDRCRFINGYNAISITDNYTGIRNNHSFITNCEFVYFKENAVFAQYFGNITIEDNYMYSNGTRGVTGIEFIDGTGVISVRRNNMDFTVSPTGIGGNKGILCTQTKFQTGSIIANNMIYLKGLASTSGGIQLNGVAQDTCNLDFVFNTVRIIGESFQGNDYPVVFGGTHGTRILNNILTSRHTDNIIVSPNADSIDYNIFYSDGLVDWLQVVPYLGPNNFSLDPLYVSTTDLHVIPTLSSNGGNYMPAVTQDFDGEVRDLSNPDIGADEIATFGTDAMISEILTPKSDTSYCGAVDNIIVVLSNIGSNTLTSCDVVLEINGSVINTLNWVGSLTTGESDTLDLRTFPYQTAQAYEFTVYTSMPNGVVDEMLLNDTIVQSDFHLGLSGVYTLGGVAPDFASFGELQLAMEKGGLCGPTVINVRNGIYLERFKLDDVVGSSEINTLTIQGESGDSSLVELRGEYSTTINYTLRLDNMQFVTIRDMKIRNSGAINNKVVWLLRVSDITLESLWIQGYSCSGCSSQTQHGLYAIYVDSNLVIDKVWCQTGNTSLQISGNSLLGSDSKNYTITNSRFGKFEIYDCYNMYIADNRMGGGFSDFDDCGYFVIERNYFASALAFWSSGEVGPSSIFRNNTMDAWETTTFSSTWDYALYLNGTGNVDIVHNTFKCRDIARSIFFSSSGADVYNNIFYRDNGTVSITTSPYHLQTLAVVVNSDYNVFWVENPNGADPLGYLQSFYGLDSNSIYVDPQFSTHPDSLFWPTNPLVDNFGTPAWNVADDFYGTIRPAVTDPGAIDLAFAPNPNLGADTTICGGIQLGWIDQGYTYSWNTGQSTSSIQVDTSGTYILTVTNALGTDSDTVNVTVSGFPSISLADTVWHCFSDSVSLEINQAGLSFEWSNGDTDSIAVYTGNQFASVEVTNAAGCQSTADFEVIELDSIEVAFSITNEQCIGQENGSIAVQTSNALTPVAITWAHTTSTNDSLGNLPAGTYFVTITDAQGCVLEDSAEVAQGNSYPVIALSDTNYHCFGVPAVLDVSQSGLTYEWSTTETSPSISVLGDQAVSVIATNTFGCSDTATTMVLSHPEIQFTTSYTDETCNGLNDGSAEVTITAGLTPIGINWPSIGSNNTILENLAPGNYFFTLTDTAACEAQGSVTILPGTNLAPSISAPALGCENTSILFTGSSSGTNQDWYVDGAFDSSGSTANLTFGSTGNFTIELVASDGICADTVQTIITIGGPNTGIDAHTTCSNSFTWIDGVTYTVSNNTATYMLSNVFGCDSIVTLNLTMNTPSASTDQITACESYTWQDGNTYTSSNNTAQWILTNAQGCDSIITLDLTILQPSTGVDVVTACDSFTWIDGIMYTSNNTTATYVLTNAEGCDSLVTLNLTINTVNTAVIENDPELTAPVSMDSYQWIDCGNGFTPIAGETSQTFVATANGSYAVIIEKDGCTDTSDCFTIVSASALDLEKLAWRLSPNPTQSTVQIQFDQPSNAKIIVLNPLGQIISSSSIENVSETQVELGNEAGVYFVKVQMDGEETSVPIVKL